MARWKNGAPRQLYILVINATGVVLLFETREARTEYVRGLSPYYTDDTYVFRTYVQKEA
jgi:hypothetical protein